MEEKWKSKCLSSWPIGILKLSIACRKITHNFKKTLHVQTWKPALFWKPFAITQYLTYQYGRTPLFHRQAVQKGCWEPELEPKSRVERVKTEKSPLDSNFFVCYCHRRSTKSSFEKYLVSLITTPAGGSLNVTQSNMSIKISLSSNIKDKMPLVNPIRKKKREKEREK